MQDNYYLPNISEFIQGFKFEKLVNQSFRMDYISEEGVVEGKTITTEDWIPCIVDWKYDNKEILTSKYILNGNEYVVSMDGVCANFFSANDDDKIIKLINKGLVRAKRK